MTCTGSGVRGEIVSFVSYRTAAVQQIFLFAAVQEVLPVSQFHSVNEKDMIEKRSLVFLKISCTALANLGL